MSRQLRTMNKVDSNGGLLAGSVDLEEFSNSLTHDITNSDGLESANDDHECKKVFPSDSSSKSNTKTTDEEILCEERKLEELSKKIQENEVFNREICIILYNIKN